MKKIVSLAAACMLILAMSLNVCAAPSVSKLPSAIATADESMKVDVKNTSAQYTKNARSVLAQAAQISEEEASTYTAISTFNLSAAEPGEIKIFIAGIKAGDEVIVLNKCAVHDWESIPAVAGNGFVIGTFHNYSNVVVFVKAGATSPKTADAGVAAAAVIAVIAVAGLAVSKKKFA